MSQHKFSSLKDGKRIEVMAGWDRPLQYVFLTVESTLVEPEGLETMPEAEQLAFAERLDEESEWLFNNLLTPIKKAEEVGMILRKLEIPIPEGFEAAIAADEQANVGNKVVEYTM